MLLKTIGYGTFGFLCFLSFLMTVQRLYWLYIIYAEVLQKKAAAERRRKRVKIDES